MSIFNKTYKSEYVREVIEKECNLKNFTANKLRFFENGIGYSVKRDESNRKEYTDEDIKNLVKYMRLKNELGVSSNKIKKIIAENIELIDDEIEKKDSKPIIQVENNKKENNKKEKNKKEKNNSVVLNIRLGTSSIDMDIKRFLHILQKKKAEALSEVLHSFVLNLSYDFNVDKSIKVSSEIVGIKISFSQLHSPLLYNWYFKYISKSLNEGGIIKQLIHYHIYKDKSKISIDIAQYRDKLKESIVMEERSSEILLTENDSITNKEIGTQTDKVKFPSRQELRILTENAKRKNYINKLIEKYIKISFDKVIRNAKNENSEAEIFILEEDIELTKRIADKVSFRIMEGGCKTNQKQVDNGIKLNIYW